MAAALRSSKRLTCVADQVAFATRSGNAAFIQVHRKSTAAAYASRTQLGNERLYGIHSELARGSRRDDATIATELHTTPLRGLQRFLGALADHATLLFGDHGHDPDGEPVRRRHVGCNEVDAGLLQTEKEMGIAAESVEFGDDELGAVTPAGLNGLCQLRAIIACPIRLPRIP
jgi:hypothetical protein